MYLSIISESRLDVLSPYSRRIYPTSVLHVGSSPPNAIQCGWCATLLCYGHCDLWIHSFYVFVLLLPLRHFISQRYSFGKFSRFIRHHHRIVPCAMVASYKVCAHRSVGLLFNIISTFKRWERAHFDRGECVERTVMQCIIDYIFKYSLLLSYNLSIFQQYCVCVHFHIAIKNGDSSKKK